MSEYIKTLQKTLVKRFLEGLSSSKKLLNRPEDALRDLNRSKRHTKAIITEAIQIERGEPV